MASYKLIAFLVIVVTLSLHGNNNTVVVAQLRQDFYSVSCPLLLSIVRAGVSSAVIAEPRMGASLLRLFYLDCFVNGCDGSILLDDTSSFTGEQNAAPNHNSARGFNVIDNIKTAVENACNEVVSCADILAMAAKESVELFGGPHWELRLGRKDSRTASQAAANSSIPAPTSSLSELISRFANLGLSTRDLVALSGAHTIGYAQCKNFRTRIYNDKNIDTVFAFSKKFCSKTPGTSDGYLSPLDYRTPLLFDNRYFMKLMDQKGLLHSDQELFNSGSTDSIVAEYSENLMSFRNDFAAAMTRMSEISPLTGDNGEIRKNCGRIN